MNEEHFIEEIDCECGDEEVETLGNRSHRHERLEKKNKTAISRFLGKEKRHCDVGIMPRYYGELLSWALKRHLEKEEWQIVQTLGYHGTEPVYMDVNTDYDKRENLLMDGQLLVQKGGDRLILTVDINLRWRNSVLVEGPASKKEQIAGFIQGVMNMAKEQNFYRGKKIEFSIRPRFLDLNGRRWDDIVLDAGIKREIRSNTIDFLKKTEVWSKLGIPPKRGVLLAGEPGTGKTIICKALMAEAEGLTCITTSAYALDACEYLTDLYELAEDLKPCLVFIEDIDLIGQNREEFGYQRGNALLALLAVLDGVEQKKEIVTVATTNCLETLDRALSQRPSRFDRVIKLSNPNPEQRKELINRLCEKIPLAETDRDYIARHSEGCTPAQLQEVVFSLAIEHSDSTIPEKPLAVSAETIDCALAKINGKNKSGLGFRFYHNGCKPDRVMN